MIFSFFFLHSFVFLLTLAPPNFLSLSLSLSLNKANVQLNQELNAVENLTMARRGDVTSVKKQRDLVRDENKELRLKQGFSSSSGLKTDFDSRKGKLEDIKAEINELRERYDILQRKVLASSTSTMKK